MLAIKDKCPGQKECDDAIDTLNDSINTIDQALLEVVSNSLQPSPASSLQVSGWVDLSLCVCVGLGDIDFFFITIKYFQNIAI